MNFTALGLLILRFGLGITMAMRHGLPKLLDFSHKMQSFPDPLHIGSTLSLSLTIVAELFCAVLIAIGLFTRVAAVPLIIVMAVAFFMVHSGSYFKVKELTLIYLFGFSALFCAGAGAFSVDAIFRRVK
jgi:putative oxidoreductase